MKIFLFDVTIYDGVHQYSGHALIKAKDQDTAWKIGKKEVHDVDDEDNGKYWNYGDGLTGTKARGLQEISKEEAETLTRLNIVHYLN